MKRIAKKLTYENHGQLYSIELLLSIILILFIIGAIANISDRMNEKILSRDEMSALEDMSIESADYLLNNPGNPDDWENDEGLKNGIVSKKIIPGLAIKDNAVENGFFIEESPESEEVLINTISYRKLMRLKRNYDELINSNLFNSSLKSSISIYPINKNLNSISMGDELDGENVVAVNRTVQCDYYSNLVIYRFNDLEYYKEGYEKTESCNHDTNPNLTSHKNDRRTIWICKNFRIYRNSLANYNYYLISDTSIKHANSYYILESLNRSNEDLLRLDKEVINLNPYFIKDLENSSNEIYSIHFKINREKYDDFKTVLVAVPKNMTNDMISNNQLRYEYFNSQEVNFVLKTSYK